MTVEERLTQIEGELQALQGAQDSITPNAYFINSAGKVEEQLTGFLEAQGVQFTEQESEASEPEGERGHSVRWLDAAKNVASLIFGRVNPALTQHQLTAEVVEPGIPHPYLRLSSAPGSAYIDGGINNNGVGEQPLFTLMTQAFQSSFLQLAGTILKLRLSWGYISQAGGIEWGSPDFTAKGTGGGGYEIEWRAARGKYIALACALNNAFNIAAQVTSITATAMTVALTRISPFEGMNTPFFFIAIGE